MSIIKFIAFACLFVVLNSFAKESPALNNIEEFDLRSYHPEANGLKDLVFEVRSESIIEELKRNEAMGKIVDVYFKIYWKFPNQYSIRVEGVPEGFNDVKDRLNLMIRPYLELVIPEKFAPKFKQFKLKVVKDGQESFIKGTDPTGKNAVSEIELYLDSKNRPTSLKTLAMNGRSQIDFTYDVKSWGQNKWVLNKAVTTNFSGPVPIYTTQEITYELIEGIGLPKEVSVKIHSIDNDKKDVDIGQQVFKFSKYEINTGKAAKAMQVK